MPRFTLTRTAEADVREIWLYVANDDLAAADRLVDRFTGTYELLAQHPEMGEQQERYLAGLRRFTVGSYAIFYVQITDGILVYRVLHGARDIDELF